MSLIIRANRAPMILAPLAGTRFLQSLKPDRSADFDSSDTMLLEHRTVSRKTPRDGKLEISGETAGRLSAIPGDLQVVVGRARGAGAVTSMACTCRGAGEEHVHHFLGSDLFLSLVPERRVKLDLDAEAGSVVVSETD